MEQGQDLLVRATPDGFYPQTMWWQGRLIRVLYVEAVYTSGLERHYAVRTGEGTYELALHTGLGAWRVRRSPSRLGRVWARLQNMPRYPLPARQRRGRARNAGRPHIAVPSTGGSHANRLALVQQ